MKIRNNKLVLSIIVIITIILIALAGYATYGHIKGFDKIVEPENIAHEFHFNNKLYFYENDTLLGRYECKTNSCDYAKFVYDDKQYILNVYPYDDTIKSSIINSRYTFIKDDRTILYDIVNAKVVKVINNVKNYGIGLDNNLFIIQDTNNKWGVEDLSDTAKVTIPYEYDYIGVHNKLRGEVLDSSLFAVKNNNGWKIVDNRNVAKSSYFSSDIYDYIDGYVIIKKSNNYYLNNYNANIVFSNYYEKLEFIENYIGIYTKEKEFYIFDAKNNTELISRIKYSNINDISYEITKEKIEIKLKGIVTTSIVR